MNIVHSKSSPPGKITCVPDMCEYPARQESVVDTMGSSTGFREWMRSRTVQQAYRNAGLTLYEILGMAELMRVAYEKGEPESLQHRIEVLLAEASDLRAALSDLLELSRLEAEPIQPAYVRFDIVSLLREISQAARESIGNRPVTVMDVSSPGPVVILSDPGMIRRIMTRLMDNAAKFTDRGRIALILNRDKNRIRLTVTDTGRGMHAEEISAICDAADRSDDGRPGLGIRIVQHLIKALDGSMAVSSKAGEGTIIEVSLPVGAGDTAGMTKRNTETVHGKTPASTREKVQSYDE